MLLLASVSYAENDAVCAYNINKDGHTAVLTMESSPLGNLTLTLNSNEAGFAIRTGSWTGSDLSPYKVNDSAAKTYYNAPVVSSDNRTITITVKSPIPDNAVISFSGPIEWRVDGASPAYTPPSAITIHKGSYCCKQGSNLKAEIVGTSTNSIIVASRNDCLNNYYYRLKYKVFGYSGEYAINNDYTGAGNFTLSSLLSDTKYDVVCEASSTQSFEPGNTESVQLYATTLTSQGGGSETCGVLVPHGTYPIEFNLETSSDGSLEVTMLTPDRYFVSEIFKPRNQKNDLDNYWGVYVNDVKQGNMSDYFNYPAAPSTDGVATFKITKKENATIPANAVIKFSSAGQIKWCTNSSGASPHYNTNNVPFTHTYGTYCCTSANAIKASAGTPVQNKVQINFTNPCIEGESYTYRVAYWVKSTPGVVKYKNFTASSTSVNLVGLQGETTYEAKVQAAYPDFNAPAKTLNSNIVEFTTGVAPASVIVACD